jgi:hypothetical protein
MSASRDPNPGDGNELLEWLGSEAGQHPIKASDAIRALLEDVQLDVRQRILLWPDGQARAFEESVAQLHQQEPQAGAEDAANVLIDWLEDPERLQESACQDCSGEELQGLARMLDEWIEELDRQRASP